MPIAAHRVQGRCTGAPLLHLRHPLGCRARACHVRSAGGGSRCARVSASCPIPCAESTAPDERTDMTDLVRTLIVCGLISGTQPFTILGMFLVLGGERGTRN